MSNVINPEKLKEAKERLSKYTKQKLWEDVLKSIGCYPDEETGNCACDNGAYCDKCQAPWVDEVYKLKLIEEYEKKEKTE